MLVLSRKLGEVIRVGDDVEVTVVRIGPNAVRLGITAPKGVNIVREELVKFNLPIQANESDIEDLGRKQTEYSSAADRLGELLVDQRRESRMIDHG